MLMDFASEKPVSGLSVASHMIFSGTLF